MKNKLTQLGLALPSLLLAFTTLTAVPALAQHGADDSAVASSTQAEDKTTAPTSSSSGSGSSGSGSNKTTASQKTETEHATKTEVQSTSATETETHHSDAAELHSRGKDLVAQLQKEHKSNQTPEERTKKCESRKDGLSTKFTRIVTNSQAIQTKIDGIFTKAQAYKTTNNLTVDNYDALVAAATTAGSTSAASIASLQTVQPTIDCNSATVAQDIATFKTATEQARTNLKAYKAAVKALLHAVADAKQATGTTTGGN